MLAASGRLLQPFNVAISQSDIAGLVAACKPGHVYSSTAKAEQHDHLQQSKSLGGLCTHSLVGPSLN